VLIILSPLIPQQNTVFKKTILLVILIWPETTRNSYGVFTPYAPIMLSPLVTFGSGRHFSEAGDLWVFKRSIKLEKKNLPLSASIAKINARLEASQKALHVVEQAIGSKHVENPGN